MCLGRRNQTAGWADGRGPTSSPESRNGGAARSSPTLLSGCNQEFVLNTFLSDRNASIQFHQSELTDFGDRAIIFQAGLVPAGRLRCVKCFVGSCEHS